VTFSPRPTATLAALVAVLALAGCGGDGDGGSPTTPAGGPLVSFHKAGGIAFTKQSLTVQPNGEAELTGTSLKRAAFTLDAEELRRLEAALDEHPIDELEPPPTDTGCADCYSYELEYGGGKYAADDASISAGAREVVAAIDDVIAERGPPQSGY
jgi:hypothetical protein